MRTPLMATLLGLSLVACAGQIDGGGGDPPENCGNGTLEIEDGEICDDSNNVDGDGCSAICTSEVAPSIGGSVDKPTVALDLGKTDAVTLNLTSMGGFDGPVAVAATLVDAADAPIAGLTVTGPTSVNVSLGQTAPVIYTIDVATNTTGTALAATLKLDITSSAGTQNFTSTINVTPTYIISYTTGTGEIQTNHPVLVGAQTKNVTVKRGATVGYKNDDVIPHVSHGDGGFDHESTAENPPGVPLTGQPGQTYSVPTIAMAPGETGNLGCHSHDGPNGYVTFTVE